MTKRVKQLHRKAKSLQAAMPFDLAKSSSARGGMKQRQRKWVLCGLKAMNAPMARWEGC